MRRTYCRRSFVFAAAGAALIAVAVLACSRLPLAGKAGEKARAGKSSPPFSFVVLGDTHFDRLSDHDMAYVEQKHSAGDVRQIQNYSKLTETVLPKTFAEVREVAATFQPRVAFVAQLGDLVEGLCGSPERAQKQCEGAIAFVRQAELGVPFLMTKGNHDVTGPGAPESYERVILPFLSEQARRAVKTASFAYEHNDALFVFYDAFDRGSLDWLEKTLAARRARHVFVFIHVPVVPIGARSLWYVYSNAKQQAQRERLVNLLGKHHAVVFCAHLHKFGALVRKTGEGRFVQICLNSVITSPDKQPASEVSGVERYGPDLVKLEPQFEPNTEERRREVLRVEAPFIEHYEYAEGAGYGVIAVNGADVRVRVYAGLGRRLWKTFDISEGSIR